MQTLAARSPQPPGPHFAILQTIRLARDPYRAFAELKARYGDLVSIPTLDGPRVLALSPKYAASLLTLEPEGLGSFWGELSAPIFGARSVLISEGELHRRQRRLLTPPFHGQRMQVYGKAMRSVACSKLDELWRVGEQVRVHDATTAITLEIMLYALFGVDRGSDLLTVQEIVRELLRRMHPAILFTAALRVDFFPPWVRFVRARERFGRWLRERVQERRRRSDGGQDILGLMLAAQYDDGTTMSDEDIATQLHGLLFAGHESTAIALAWAVHWLFGKQSALERVRKEIIALGEDPAPEALAKLPYLSAVCDETLRLNPIITEIHRVLRRPLQIGDYELPAGMGVGVAIPPIHLDPTIYKEPARFHPDRFLERRYSPFEYLPFGGGHRRCIGAAFALYQMKIVLATIVKNWDLALVGASDERPVRRNVTMGPALGVPVRVLNSLPRG